MRKSIPYIIRLARQVCRMLFFILFASTCSLAQDTMQVYTVKNGEMYIWLSKKLSPVELDRFIAQYDLHQLGLKRFINSGNDDSIKLSGWKIELNNSSTLSLSKPLFSSIDLINPVKRIDFTAMNVPLDARFPAVSNNVLYGCNRFRNKSPFAIQDSVVTFFLRNNLNAKRVMLAGSFNKWNPNILSMTKTDSGWIAYVKLYPGKYWYKFIVDGSWTIDTDNRLNENDGLGNTNSVFYYTNTIFKLNEYTNAKKVFLAGSFNNWKENDLPMERTADGWKANVYLANGTHRYRFIVDGNWLTDPANPDRFPNEFGDYNSVIAIGKPYLFKLEGYANASKVVLAGSFNKWRTDELFMKKTAGGWEFFYVLGPGNYEYRFMADGKWVNVNSEPNSVNNPNSVLILDPNFTFHLKGFETAKTVFLIGDFNDWNPNSLPMKKENGEWKYTVHLYPGKHVYKFIVDGKWIIDPDNKLFEENENDIGNSVIWVEK